MTLVASQRYFDILIVAWGKLLYSMNDSYLDHPQYRNKNKMSKNQKEEKKNEEQKYIGDHVEPSSGANPQHVIILSLFSGSSISSDLQVTPA